MKFQTVLIKILIALLVFALSFQGQVEFKSFDMDSSPRDLVWCGPARDTVFVLTETNSLYRSDDKGFTWKKLNDIMTNTGKDTLEENENEIGKVSQILMSPVDKNLVIFLGTHGINWVSHDCGRKVEAMNHGRKITEFIFHPFERDWVLASAYTICEDFGNEPCRNFKEIFITKNMGNDWDLLLSYVVQFNWGVTSDSHHKVHGIPKERIIASYDPRGRGDQKQIGWNYKIDLIYSDDFFRTKKIAAHKGNKFLLTDHYLFVAQVADQELQEVLLLVSDSTKLYYSFESIHLNNGKFSEHSYTFLDTSEQSVFLHVNHFGDSSSYGHVYISDENGIKYSLSLPHNVRSHDNQCDFEKVNGLDGIFIANAIDSEFMKNNYKELEKEEVEDEERMDESPHKRNKVDDAEESSKNYIRTLMTFNKGGNWENIKAPNRDSLGKLYDCEDSESCFLHLHGISSDFAPFYSVESAAGILLANGNVGEYLSNDFEEVSTFLSRDGGNNWFEVKKGSHIYEIGDHGALIVMAQDQHPTDIVLYSWDEGLTWQELRLDEKITVRNIIIEPLSTALHFVLYGETQTKKGKKRGVVVGLNFSTLNERRCSNPEEPDSANSDYEKWSPSDGRQGNQCLLGKKTIYVRRKREVDCFNGLDFERKNVVEHCECTHIDYECDEGFTRANHSTECIPINEQTHRIPKEGDIHDPPQNCNNYFTISRGYRKVPGNVCINGIKFDPIKVPCPYSGFFSSLGMIFFVLILIVLFGLFFLAFNNSFIDKLKELVEVQKSSNNPNFSYYSDGKTNQKPIKKDYGELKNDVNFLIRMMKTISYLMMKLLQLLQQIKQIIQNKIFMIS